MVQTIVRAPSLPYRRGATFRDPSEPMDALYVKSDCSHTASHRRHANIDAVLASRLQRMCLSSRPNIRHDIKQMLLHLSSDDVNSRVGVREIPHSAEREPGLVRGWTPLHLAASVGNSGVLQVLVESANADVTSRIMENFTLSDRHNYFAYSTPLHIAASHLDCASAQVLVSPACIHSIDALGFTAMHHAALGGTCLPAIGQEHQQMTQSVTRADTEKLKEDGWKHRDFQSLECMKLLRRHGADVNAQRRCDFEQDLGTEPFPRLPTTYTAPFQQIESLQREITRHSLCGENIELDRQLYAVRRVCPRTRTGSRMVMWAMNDPGDSLAPNSKYEKELRELKRKAKLSLSFALNNSTNDEGNPPRTGSVNTLQTPLWCAVACSNVPVINWLVNTCGVNLALDVDASDRTVLHVAALDGQAAVCNVLILTFADWSCANIQADPTRVGSTLSFIRQQDANGCDAAALAADNTTKAIIHKCESQLLRFGVIRHRSHFLALRSGAADGMSM